MSHEETYVCKLNPESNVDIEYRARNATNSSGVEVLRQLPVNPRSLGALRVPRVAEAPLIKSCPPFKKFDSKGLYGVFQTYAEFTGGTLQGCSNKLTSFANAWRRVRFKWNNFIKAALTNREITRSLNAFTTVHEINRIATPRLFMYHKTEHKCSRQWVIKTFTKAYK